LSVVGKASWEPVVRRESPEGGKRLGATSSNLCPPTTSPFHTFPFFPSHIMSESKLSAGRDQNDSAAESQYKRRLFSFFFSGEIPNRTPGSPNLYSGKIWYLNFGYNVDKPTALAFTVIFSLLTSSSFHFASLPLLTQPEADSFSALRRLQLSRAHVPSLQVKARSSSLHPRHRIPE